MINHHRISKEKFPFLMKERECPYNNREKDLFAVLVNLMLFW